MYTRPERAHARVDRGQVRLQAQGARRQPGRVPGRARLRRDRRAVRPPLPGQAGRRSARASTPTSPATPPWPGAWWPPASSAQLPVFLGSYPITPASDILHELSKHKNFGVRTLQAEDEIAGIGAALGAAFGGHLGVTTTSGPGVALKSETMGLAVSLELPLLIDRHPARRPVHRPAHQDRAGRPAAWPCTAATASRRCPSSRPTARPHCFEAAIEAARHRPQVPHAGDPALRRLPGQRLRAVAAARRRRPARHRGRRSPPSPTTRRRRRAASSGPTCATPRPWPAPWALPGTPGLMHRIGGIEKEDGTGNISYDPENHERMVDLRAAKVAGIATTSPTSRSRRRRRRRDPRASAGAPPGAPSTAPSTGCGPEAASVAQVHLVHLNPFPPNLGRGAAPLPARCWCPR